MTFRTITFDGLEGINPLGYLAALGALGVTTRAGRKPRLAWQQTVLPVAQLLGMTEMDELVDIVLADRDAVLSSTALTFALGDEPLSDVKFEDPSDTATYLRACREADDDGLSEGIAAALIAEVSVDGKGNAKPSDLHLTAGRQLILDMARALGETLTVDDVREALAGPWSYTRKTPSFMWDVADDRVYALSAVNPASDAKVAVPGADWLAFRGLTALPVVGRTGRTLTPGTAGRWKEGAFSWPLWQDPIGWFVIECLQAALPRSESQLQEWVPPKGVFRVLTSNIVRSDQGGYGTIRPPRVVWERQG